MKRKSAILKCAAFLLTAGLATGLLTGCGGGTSTSSQATMDKEHVYHGEYYDLPEGMTNINSMKVVNDHIYVDGVNEDNNYQYQIISMNPDGTDIKNVYEAKNNGEESVSAYTVDQDENIYLFKQVYKEDASDPENVQYSNKSYITKVGVDGKQISEEEIDAGEDFYPNAMLIDGNGNLMILSYNSLVVYDKNLKPATTIDTSNSYVDSAFLSDDGKIMITQYTADYTSREVKEYDEASKKFTEPKSMGEGMSNYSFFQATGYDLYMKDNTDLYGYDMESGEKTKILNWIDSDIDGSYISGLAGLSDGRIVCATTNWNKNTSELAVLTKVDPKDVVDKTMITVATVYDMQLSGPIIEFNKKSDKYRITLKDYSIYSTDEDPLAGYNKMNTDLASGVVPDILCVSETTPFDSFTSKGLFMDLNELIDKDDSFNKSDYLENIFKAFEVDGKQYSVAPYFQAISFVGKTSEVGDKMGWSMDDLQAVMAKKPEGTKIMSDVSKDTIMLYGSYLCMDEYVDWKSGTCDFESGSFKKLLEFADQFPSQEEYEKEQSAQGDIYTGEDMSYRKGTTLLQMSYIYDFREFHRLQKVTFGEDVTFVGFPSETTNGSAFTPGVQLAISSKAVSQEAAWEFVKSFFTDDYQDNLSYGWPVKLSSLEKMKQRDQKPETYIDENGKEVENEETYSENGKEVKLGLVTDEECEKVMNFLKNVSQVMRYDEKINTIITEESGAYFAGQKSADETCKLVQNRVQTYMSESK